VRSSFLFHIPLLLTPSSNLSTSGVPFACDPLVTVIPPGSFHTVRLTGTPREPGTLVIRGCNIRLAGCRSREFILPVWDTAEEAKQHKAALLDTSRERIKETGLEAAPRTSRGTSSLSNEGDLEDSAKFLECVVVPEQPLLWMRSTSLTHGALMLYDGEVFVSPPSSYSFHGC
jgi:hypothetical protein